MEYEEFLASKMKHDPATGLSDPGELHPSLFPFQRDLTQWAIRRGRAAIFANTGMGKTRLQLTWARRIHEATGKDVLVLAPLAVARQTTGEAKAIDIEATLCRDGKDVRPGINVTNYDRLHRFDTGAFGAVVLDESSCIKHHDAKTLGILIEAFAETPYKLCCTATPAPNDWTELGTHAEFLGVCSRVEMLSEFFCHDGGETQTWRLKGHARGAFWKWVSSWAALVSHPRDLGYDEKGFDLPPLRVHEHTIKASEEVARASGSLFVPEATGLMERRQARRASIHDRVAECAALVNTTKGEPFLVWTDLNAESESLTEAIDGAVEITGSMDPDEKESRLVAWLAGESRVLVTKSSIAGWGINAQCCSKMAFVGVTDSFEAYYQAVRRCWRFGQKRPVDVHVFASEAEGSVVANLRRKERDAEQMARELSRETAESVRAEVRGTIRQSNAYEPEARMALPSWLVSEGEA